MTELDVTVRPPTGRIEGRVQGADGEPVADAFVVAHASDPEMFEGRERPVLTDADGRFVIEGLADRPYGVHARGPGDPRARVRGRRRGRPVARARARAARARARYGEDERRARRALHGPRRRDPPAPHVHRTRRMFELDRVEPGKLRLAVASDTGATSVILVVEPGATKDVAVELGAWGNARGILVDGSGTPLPGITIRVDAPAGRRPEAKGMALLISDDIQTDAEGRFELEGIGPGRATLDFAKGSAVFSGEMLGEHRFTVEAGETVDLGRVTALAPVDVPKAERGWLGFETRMAPTFAAKGRQKDDNAELFLFVDEVHAGTPAATAGLREGDGVVAIDDVEESELGIEHPARRAPSRAAARRYVAHDPRAARRRTS